MSKSKAKSTSSSSHSSHSSRSRRASPEAAEKPKKGVVTEEKTVPAEWSAWIWDQEFKSYYRGRLGADGKWEYESATLLEPAPAVQTVAVVESPKHDTSSSVVYEAGPTYVFEQPYTLALVSEAVAIPLATEAVAAKAPAPAAPAKGKDKAEEKEEKKIEEKTKDKKSPVKAESGKSPAPTKRKERVQNWDRIVAYLEEQEKREMKLWRREKRKRYAERLQESW